MTKFETTGSVLTVKLLGRKRSRRTSCSFARQCRSEYRKIDSPTFAAVGYTDHFIASNFP